MTRINLVPPAELTDQHLFAEFREMKMVPMSLRRSLAARGLQGVLSMVPREYTLGKGHVSFFYDKGAYMQERYARVRAELSRRGVRFDQSSALDSTGVWQLPGHGALWKNYIPTETALALIRARIAEKIALKPDWYRKTQ
jgi:deoxyribonuclease (pyrimidine dimer)